MSDLEARLACASALILQSAPGEINDVFNDVRALVNDDEALEAGILPALQQYNVEQLIVAELPDKQQLMICSSGSVQDQPGRYIEPSTAQAWLFDHLRLSASDPLPVQVDEECEAYRKELEQAAQKYGQEHFSEGVSKVFTSEQRRLKPKPKEQTSVSVEPASNATSSEAGAAPSEQTPSGGVDPKPVDAENVAKSEQSATTIADLAAESTDKSDVETALQDPEAEGPAGSEDLGAAAIEQPSEGDTAGPTEQETVDVDMVTNAPTPAAPPMDTDEPEATTTTATETVSEPEPEPVEPLPKTFSLHFAGNKYNPSNYWTGRWRSSYQLDLTGEQPSLKGTIQINVHFFEQGNVQLSTKHEPTITLPESTSASSAPAEIAKAVIKGIKMAEEEYQLELNETYRDMADKTFRNLRRVLPVTRQKMDWAKVASYKIGRNLSGGAAQ